jgi:diguanylate cyclase (GGDEF)-like protein/PAS domain S-box-containing protein
LVVALRPSNRPIDDTDDSALLVALRKAHLLHTFLETTPDHVYFKDSNSKFTEISRSLAEWMGLKEPADAVGKSDFDFFDHEHAQQAFDDEMEIIRTGQPLVDVEERETWEDGTETWVATTKLPLRDEDGQIIGTFGLSRDITARKSAELEVKRNQERMASIIATQRDVATANLDLDSIMSLVAARTHELTNADGAALLLLEGEYLNVKAAAGCVADEVRVRIPLCATMRAAWLDGGAAVTCAETRTLDAATALDRRVLDRTGARSLVAVPLRHDQQTVGLLEVVSTEAEAFGPRDVESLELLSVVLSAAMSHASEFAAKREQVDALAQFRAMYEGAPIGIIFTTVEGAILEANPAISEIFGYASDELEGEDALELVSDDDREQARVELARLLDGDHDGDVQRLDIRYYNRDGEVIWATLALSLVRDSDGEPGFVIQMIEDITARKHAEEELRRHAERTEYQALHDALTGLPNRVLFHDRIQQALLTAEREGGRVAVLLMDLDRFKEINDTLGHAAGDHVLKEVATRLHDCLRASDTVARLGGDEFGLLLPKQNEPSEITYLLDKLSATLEEPIDLDGLPLGIEGSIGVAFFPDHGLSADDLLKRADVAMYAAKQDNQPYSFYEQTAEPQDTTRLTLLSELRRALDERQLVLYYQPKARLRDGAVESVEALIRWNHPERGFVPPDQFIPQAQETGLMKPLTLYVLREALQQVKAWQANGVDLSVAVNLATRNLIDTAFPDDVAAALAETGVDASRLELEITESTMLEDPFRTKLVLDRLHAMGIRLSIDDFGTGYSSLAYLRQLPVSEIKIDRSFVMNMHDCDDDAVIVRSTVDLGRNLGLEVVAEGVETAEAWAQLAELGCELVQGYFLSRPIPPDEIEAWVQERRLVRTTT